MGTILAIDGNSILNRAFYGVKALTNKSGMQTGALFGMLNIILAQYDRISPDGVAVAFDLPTPTFRHKMYDKYKSNRHGMPEELALQLPYAKKILSALGYSIITKEGYEADDILGTLSKLGEGEGNSVYILSGDRDLFQLISDKTKILHASTGETKEFGHDEFFEKYGIRVDQFIDLKALMGDASDCIPGVAGIGEKTGIKLIAEYSSLEGLYEHIGDLKPGSSMRSKLESGKDDAFLSRELATINRDVPLGITCSDVCSCVRDDAALLELFTELEFGSFIKRLNVNAQKEAPASPEKKVDKEFIESLSGELYASFTDSSVSISDGKSLYSCETDSLSDIKGLFRDDVKLCVFNSKELYRKLSDIGIDDFNFDFDIMLAAYTVNPSESEFTLQKLAFTYLGEECAESGKTVYELAKILKEKIENDSLHFVYYDVEHPLAKILCSMEKHGFKIDRQELESYSQFLAEQISQLQNTIYESAGGEFNINSPKQLGEVLFERLGLPGKKKKKTGSYSTNAEVLESLRPYYPIIDLILNYRKLTKLRSTYTEGLLKVADPDGMVHTDFKQTGTVTGRLSSAEPNLQNIPIRTEEGRLLRRFFIPEREGRVLIDADYSQIELRILAHLSGDENMINAFRSGADIHSSTACRVFGVSEDEVTSEMRKRAKAINFGLIYGMSDFSLSQDLGIPLYKASEYIESYFNAYPTIRSYLDSCVSFAKENGYSLTMFGRRRYIPELSAGKGLLRSFGERVAKNAPIQGSAADIIKIAMINTFNALKEAKIDAKLILQVHDELIIDSSEKDSALAGEILVREMENAAKLSLPLSVEMKMGKNWYECK